MRNWQKSLETYGLKYAFSTSSIGSRLFKLGVFLTLAKHLVLKVEEGYYTKRETLGTQFPVVFPTLFG